MRARVFGGRSAEWPSWAVLRVDSGRVLFECERCGEEQDLTPMSQHDAERALGRLARVHARCRARPTPEPAPEPESWITTH